jgi:calmodulin
MIEAESSESENIQKIRENEAKQRDIKRIKEVKEAFEVFDKNNDGFITLKELSTVMRSSGYNYTLLELQDMMKFYDKDESGTIDYKEFEHLMIKKNKQYDEEIELIETFKAFDRNCDGRISAQELKDVFEIIGKELTSKEIDELISQCDIDEDGEIDFEEFVELMTLDNNVEYTK